jgi:hypothetical protein
MALLRILLAILLTASLGASTPWTLQDKALEGVFVAAATADWGQTLGVDRWAKGNDTRRETNGALGKHPSRGSVNVYFAAMLLIPI